MVGGYEPGTDLHSGAAPASDNYRFRFGGPGLEFWHEEIRGNASSEFALEEFGLVRGAYQELLRLVRRRPLGWEWQVHVVITTLIELGLYA